MAKKPETMMIDDIRYVREDSIVAPVAPDSEVRIVLLQRGNVLVGYHSRSGDDCKLERASVIRRWGTTKGLGEIASGGPTADTILDPANGVVEYDRRTEVMTIACNDGAWTCLT